MWRLLFRPLLFLFDPERVHHVAMSVFALIAALPGVRAVLHRRLGPRDPRLRTRVLGIDFASPVGLAAGFDKSAQWFDALGSLGFSHIEVGTLTGLAQPGNPRPRLFRLPADRALLNRFGFNNPGAAAVAARLSQRQIGVILGVNIGKSKVVRNEDAVADYLTSLEELWPFARYIAVNVSSPNTPGLRALQDRGSLETLLRALQGRNQEIAVRRGEPTRPLLVKIAPDLEPEQIDEIAELALELGLDGVIATNTTVSREGLRTDRGKVEALGTGGVSGAPLTERSREVVGRLFAKLGRRVPIVGVGGVMDAEDAWQMIRAGASLVQVYSGFVYGGPAFVRRVNRGLSERVAAAGLAHIADAVGSAAR